MKYKKYSYLLVFILMLLLGVDSVHAKPFYNNKYDEKVCYYSQQNGDHKVRVILYWNLEFKPKGFWGWTGAILCNVGCVSEAAFERGDNDAYTDAYVDKLEDRNIFDEEYIINWSGLYGGYGGYIWDRLYIADGSVTFDVMNTFEQANGSEGEPECPGYVVFEYEGSHYRLWATNDEQKAIKAQDNILASGNQGFYAVPTDSTDYFQEWVDAGILYYDEEEEVTCATYEAIFGSKDDPESIRYLVNEVLLYVRICVPILVIVLGIIDFAKAVLANKEDTMKKAQLDFAKRVIMGVAVFFAPVLVEIIMELADVVWAGQFTHCPL